MKERYKIALSTIVEEFHFEVIVRPEHFDEIMIETPEVNRPGLALAGFYEVFDGQRIQLIGEAETRYLQSLEPSTKRVMLQNFVDAKPVAILYTRDLPVDDALVEQTLESLKESHCVEEAYLTYFDLQCYGEQTVQLPGDKVYKAELIDVWNMTREVIAENISGETKLTLPGWDNLALLITRIQ